MFQVFTPVCHAHAGCRPKTESFSSKLGVSALFTAISPGPKWGKQYASHLIILVFFTRNIALCFQINE